MSEKFYTILTAIGKAKIANSGVLGTKVNFVKLKVGDGNGSYYNPTEDQTDLINTVWEGNITHISVDEKNPNWVNIEIMIPANVGGFMIREYGAFDDEGNMLAIAKCAESYKPLAEDGSTKELLIKMILAVSNTENITLKIDPTIIFAKKSELEVLENKINNIKVPVTKVNEKIGNVVLTAEDIKCKNGTSVETSLDDLKTKDESLHENINKLDTNKVNNTDYSKLNLYIGTTSGSSTAYTKTVSNGQKSYVDGQVITLVSHVDCGDNPTFNLNGIGAVSLVNQNGNLKSGDMIANKPYSFVRVGNSFFIRSGNSIQLPQWAKNQSIFMSCQSMNHTERMGYSYCSCGDYIYTSGGYGTNQYGNSTDVKYLEKYNKDINTWSDISLELSYGECASESVDDNIYFFSYMSAVKKYSTQSNTYTSIDTVMGNHKQSAVIGRNIYLLGNRNYSSKYIQSFNIDTSTSNNQIEFPESSIDNFTMIANNNKLYFFRRGFDFRPEGFDLIIYDITTNTWGSKQKLKRDDDVSLRGGISYKNIIYIYGSENVSNGDEYLYKYNPSTGSFNGVVIPKNVLSGKMVICNGLLYDVAPKGTTLIIS